jgi:hypothetical protein
MVIEKFMRKPDALETHKVLTQRHSVKPGSAKPCCPWTGAPKQGDCLSLARVAAQTFSLP